MCLIRGTHLESSERVMALAKINLPSALLYQADGISLESPVSQIVTGGSQQMSKSSILLKTFQLILSVQ